MTETKKTKIEIKKILLQVGDKELRLTVEEAKELHKILGDLVAEKIPSVVIERDIISIPSPVVIPWYPVYPTYPTTWTITCGDISAGDTETSTCGTLYLSTNGTGGNDC